jgi:hypothetical protein
MLENALIPSP